MTPWVTLPETNSSGSDPGSMDAWNTSLVSIFGGHGLFSGAKMSVSGRVSTSHDYFCGCFPSPRGVGKILEVKDASPDDVAFFVMDKITLSNWDFPAGRDGKRLNQHVVAKTQKEVGVISFVFP